MCKIGLLAAAVSLSIDHVAGYGTHLNVTKNPTWTEDSSVQNHNWAKWPYYLECHPKKAPGYDKLSRDDLKIIAAYALFDSAHNQYFGQSRAHAVARIGNLTAIARYPIETEYYHLTFMTSHYHFLWIPRQKIKFYSFDVRDAESE